MYSTVISCQAHALCASCPVCQRFSIFDDWHARFDTSRFPYRRLSISIQIYPCSMKPWFFTIYKSFRKIWLVNGTRLFGSWVPAEKRREQPNIAKGSPVFPDGMLQKFVFHFFKANFDTSSRLSRPFFGRWNRFVQTENAIPERNFQHLPWTDRPVFQCKWWRP